MDLPFSFQLQDKAFEFGKNIAYAYQLREDLQNIEERKTPLVLCSSPVILSGSLPQVRELLSIILMEENTENKDELGKELINEIVEGGTAVRIQELCTLYVEKALDSLNLFPYSEAKQALVNIANSCTLRR